LKVELHDRFKVTVTPETRQERIDLAHVAGMDETSDAYIAMLTGETKSVDLAAHRSATEGGGGWQRVSVTTEYLKPYMDRLVKQFGARREDLDLGPVLDSTGRIGHTYLAESLTYTAGTDVATWTSVFQLYPYVGEKFPDQAAVDARAVAEAKKDVAGLLGRSDTPREFIDAGNGFYKRNPNYGRGITSYLLGVENPKVWKFLCHWWRENQTTPGQLALLERASQYWDKPTEYDFNYDDFNHTMKWEEFAQIQ
jgi:hypothetical protein